MKFSIITPSFRNSSWLRLCVASVADQEGVSTEHIVQDSCSDDGTLDWLPHDARVTAFIEKDTGMYDAVNRGFRRATGDIVAYLNCDEQYLPGALRTVHDFFAAHPEVDIVIPDVIVVDGNGTYICHRTSLVPYRWHVWTRFNVNTSSLFIRRRVFSELGLWFDTRWRAVGDFFWIWEACRQGLRWAELRAFVSAFSDTGDNLDLQPGAQRERAEKDRLMPPLYRILAPAARWHHRARMLVRGTYMQRPFRYEIYTKASPERRVSFKVTRPTGRWAGRS